MRLTFLLYQSLGPISILKKLYLIDYKFICPELPTGVENIGWTSKFGVWQGFKIALRGGGKREILLGEFFYQGDGNLRSDFDHLNFFQSYKHYSINSEHRSK